MDERNSDYEAEVARRAGTAQAGTPTTYIPPEARPVGQPPVMNAGAPTQPQPEAPAWSPPAQATSTPQWTPPPAPQEQPSRVYGPPTARDQRRHGPPIVGPVLLIGAGVLFLLNNLGIVDWAVWNDLWRLWPLILIAVGLDLLIGRRNPLVSLAIVVLLLGAGAAVLATTGGFRGAGNVQSSSLSVPLSGATSARVEIDLGAGNLTVDGNGAPGQLAAGTLEYFDNRGVPRQDVDTSGGIVSLKLEHRPEGFGNWFNANSESIDWNIHLSLAVPMEVKASLGAGNSELDLRNLNVTSLDIKSGAGNATVVFPEKPGRLSAKVDGGVGNSTLRIPDGVEARINIDSGIGNVDADNRFTKQGDVYVTSGYDGASERVDIDLKVGVGNVNITR